MYIYICIYINIYINIYIYIYIHIYIYIYIYIFIYHLPRVIVHVPPFINHLKITLKALLKQRLNHFIVQSFSYYLLKASAW